MAEIASCDSCGREVPRKELQEFKVFGERRLICKECRRTQARED